MIRRCCIAAARVSTLAQSKWGTLIITISHFEPHLWTFEEWELSAGDDQTEMRTQDVLCCDVQPRPYGEPHRIPPMRRGNAHETWRSFPTKPPESGPLAASHEDFNCHRESCLCEKLSSWHVWSGPAYFSGASLVAQLVKNLPGMREAWVWSLG